MLDFLLALGVGVALIAYTMFVAWVMRKLHGLDD